MNERMTAVLESIVRSDVDGAKKQLDTIAQSARSDRDKGSVTALGGILASISRGKEGTMQTWEPEKMARAATTIKKSQMADDWDRGYADVLTTYAKLAQKKE